MASADQTNALGAVGMLPRRLGRYELITPIGRGGMAIVYAGRALGRQGFERLVAIKVCFQSIREEPKIRDMFLDEAKVAAHIHHPNVVATLDARDDDELYLIMEYVSGASLAQVVRAVGREESKQIPTALALRMCCDALAGLHGAHNTRDTVGKALDLVHRDVSPQNIMIGADGVTRIVDFGIAKAVGREQETRAGEIKGKMSYLAPEQLLSEAVSPRTDVFAMGIVLWEALAGRKLFQGATVEETVMALADLKVPSLREIRPEVSAAVQAIVEKALQRESDARFASAGAMLDALEAADMNIAPQRDVAALIERLMGDKLRQRAELIRKTAEESTAAATAAAADDAHQEEPSGTPAPSELPKVADGASASRWLRKNAVLVASAALVLGSIGVIAARRKPHDGAAEPSRAATVTTPAASVHATTTPTALLPPIPQNEPAHTDPSPVAPTANPPTPVAGTSAAAAHPSDPNANHGTATVGSTTTANPNANHGTTATNGTAHGTAPTVPIPPRRRRREYRPDIL